jgi:hypothetical protein
MLRRRPSRRFRQRDQLGWAPPYWWRRPPQKSPVCYATKSAALREFVSANWRLIEDAGGIEKGFGPAEFDSINLKYDLRGKRAVRTIAQAIWQAMPPNRPYCLDRIDLEALNATTPAYVQDRQFVLPDYVYVADAAAREAEYYRQAEARAADQRVPPPRGKRRAAPRITAEPAPFGRRVRRRRRR